MTIRDYLQNHDSLCDNSALEQAVMNYMDSNSPTGNTYWLNQECDSDLLFLLDVLSQAADIKSALTAVHGQFLRLNNPNFPKEEPFYADIKQTADTTVNRIAAQYQKSGKTVPPKNKQDIAYHVLVRYLTSIIPTI